MKRPLTKRERRSVVCVLAALALWLAWRGVRLWAGSPAAEVAQMSTEGVRVYARDGRLLGARRGKGGLHGVWLPLAEVPKSLTNATLASEDKRFWSHDGIDRLALLRAAVGNVLRLKVVSGASTLSSQLVKRVDHHGKPHPRTIITKVREMARAQNLEANLDKSAILEAYLNHLDYGRGLAGPESAARGYFGVACKDLSLAQSALLAVLPRAPSALDPHRHRERAVARQQALLRTLAAAGQITDDDLQRALREPLVLAPLHKATLIAPHLVLQAAKTRQGGVATTLDLDLQVDAEAIAKAHLPRLLGRAASNIGAIVVDNATSEVLAEVGSASYFNQTIAGAVDIVQRRRQAGSTLKPFLYARRFEQGLAPTGVLPDVPSDFGTTGSVYSPDNFDGTFMGPIAAREALAGSLNIPAVRIAKDLGLKEVERTLRQLGLQVPGGADQHGLALALGSIDVSLWELAGAYRTLARGGPLMPLRDGVHSLASVDGSAPVFQPNVLAEVADILADPVARIRGLRARGPFEFPYPVAVKTGTSTGYRDAWTAGYTHERTVVVWVGNNKGQPTDKLTGASAAGPIFFELMQRAMRGIKPEPLADKNELTDVEVCPLSGELPGAACPDKVIRKVHKGRPLPHTCSMHVHARRKAEAGPGATTWACAASAKDVIVVLPESYKSLLSARPQGSVGLDPHGLPWLLGSEVSRCTLSQEADPKVYFLQPQDRTQLSSSEWQSVAKSSGGTRAQNAVRVVVATEGLPKETRLTLMIDGQTAMNLGQRREVWLPVPIGEHTLQVRPEDITVGAKLGSVVVEVR
jgi:penicillin-binding protein 1C